MKMNKVRSKVVLCVRNDDCDDLVLHKVYKSLPDKRADREGFARIIDESGEDYLYPQTYFSTLKLPRQALVSVLSSH
jgi:hypothetical protein